MLTGIFECLGCLGAWERKTAQSSFTSQTQQTGKRMKENLFSRF